MKKISMLILNVIIIILEIMPKSIRKVSTIVNGSDKEYIYTYSSHFSIETFGQGLLFPIILGFITIFLLIILVMSYFVLIKDEIINTTIVGMFVFSLSPLVLGIKGVTIYSIFITILTVALFVINNYKYKDTNS